MFSEDQGFLEGIIHVDVRGPFTPVLAKKYFQLVTELFIENNWTYQANALVWDILHALMTADCG